MINLLYWFIVGLLILGIYCIANKKNTRIKNINIGVVNVIIVVYCLIPVIVDWAFGDYPIGYFISDMIEIEKPESSDREIVGEVYEGVTIEQNFYSDYSYICGIDIYTMTYGRKNEGQLIVELLDNLSGETVYDWQIDLSEVPDEDFLELTIDNPYSFEAMDRLYTIKITTKGNNIDNAITLLQVDDEYPYGSLSIDGSEMEKDIVFSVSGYQNKYNMERVRVWICFLDMILLELLYKGWKGNNVKEDI